MKFGLAWPSILLPRLWFITWVMIYNQRYETNYYSLIHLKFDLAHASNNFLTFWKLISFFLWELLPFLLGIFINVCIYEVRSLNMSTIKRFIQVNTDLIQIRILLFDDYWNFLEILGIFISKCTLNVVLWNS